LIRRRALAALVGGILATGVARPDAAVATVQATPCAPTWSTGDSPNVGGRSNNLLGASALTGTDAWAAGYYLDKIGRASCRERV